MEQDTKSTPAELAAANNLEAQIRQFTDFSGELVGGGSVKKIMADVQAKSADLWQVAPEEIVVIPGYNPRVHNRMYYEGVASLGQNMARDGYMQDKPLAVYIAKHEGRDRLILQDGHRRHAAVLYAKGDLGAPIKTVPIVVKPKSENQVGLLKAMLHANEATPFTVYEKAVIAKRFKSFGWTDKQIAEEMGCTVQFVGEMLKLAGAPEAIQELVNSGQLAATAALDIVKTHGENAVSVAREAVKTAQAKGKSRATMKDTTPAEERTIAKTKNARKVALDMYKLLVKIGKDEATMKKMPENLVEEMDRCIAAVEKVKKAKEPAPIKVKPERPARTPVAKKVAATSAKRASSGGKKLPPWDQPQASNRVARERRSMQ